MSRRAVLLLGLLTGCMVNTMSMAADGNAGAIDRHAVVARHAIHWNEAAGRLALGNGEFCFGIDGTGLQTFSGNSMSHWGWHSFPLPEGWTPERVPATGTFQKGRNTGGDNFPPGTDAIRKWMFDNPHIMNLGRLRLRRADGRALAPGDIAELERTLDLWAGLQTSHYRIDGQPVTVETCGHPTLDLVAVRIESPLIESGALEVALDFPYAALNNDAWVGDFQRVEGHSTKTTAPQPGRMDFERTVDAVQYRVALQVAEACVIREPGVPQGVKKLAIRKAEYGAGEQWADVTAKIAAAVKDDTLAQPVNFQAMASDPAPGKAKRLRITYTLDGEETKAEIPDNQTLRIPQNEGGRAWVVSARGQKTLTLACAFAPKAVASLPTFDETKQACAKRWETFWTTGGAIDLSASKDPRWKELERRIVLSQYLLAAQSAGSWPSSENGLFGLDPWRGQFHMEMVWWHLAHYALWDRWALGDQAIACYQRFAPAARVLAEQLGYKGLKWQKSVGPEGRTAPWGGNQVLLWKQPHPIFFAELEYRLRPTRATLDKWAAIVHGTAEHMADYPVKDEKTGLYSLVPAMPPSEQGITRDTVFDLAYWRWGLDKAQEWRERLGQAREPHWDEVRKKLSPLPTLDGVFIHSVEWKDTYGKRAYEHPDPIGVLGMLPPIDGVDEATAQRTVLKVWEKWDWNRCWGWDFPWMAMAAARTGQPEMAVEALLKESGRNQFDIAGGSSGGPHPYLPSNGGLLYAVAMMAAGWDGAPKRNAPGFPDNGQWTVRWEGLKPAP